MKKLIILLLLGFTTVANAQFRKAKWGMNKRAIIKSEGTSPALNQSDKLGWKDNIAGLNTYAFYFIAQHKLTGGAYLFTGTYIESGAYIKNFKKVKSILTKKYGSPEIDRKIWTNTTFKDDPQNYSTALTLGELAYKTLWAMPKTKIVLSLKSAKGKKQIMLLYRSVKYGALWDKHLQQQQANDF